MTPSGTEPATFRLVAQCLNWMCHHEHHYKKPDHNMCTILIVILLFQNRPNPWMGQGKKTVTLVLEYMLTYATRLPHNTKVWNTARRFVCKMLLLTMYGEFWVPVDFIQANGFIQFHLRWDRTRIAWKQTKKVKYMAVTGWLSAAQLWERYSFSCSKFG